MRLMLLPGLDGTGRLFSPFLNVLPPHYSPVVVAYSTEQTLSYEELVPYVQRRIPTDEDYVVVAESFSGPIAIKLASSNPPDLKALVLCATFASNPAPLSLDLSFFLRDWQFAISPPRFLTNWFLAGRDAPGTLLEDFRKTLRTVAPNVLAFRARSLFGVDVREALRECRMPILYLVAKRDKLLKRSSLDEMLKIKPEMEVIEIDGPHFLLQRNPQECFEAIDHFVGRAVRST